MFNYLTGYGRPRRSRKVLVAPFNLAEGLMSEIERTIEAHSPERPARDPHEDELAPRPAGDQGPLPGIPGRGRGATSTCAGSARCGPACPGYRRTSRSSRSSDGSSSIRGSTPSSATARSAIYIGSADLMPRNLVQPGRAGHAGRGPELARRAGRHPRPLARRQHDAWTLDSDGRWTRRHPPTTGTEPRSVQRELIERPPRRARGGAGAMSPLSLVPRDRVFFDLFVEAGENTLRAARLLQQMLEKWPDEQRASRARSSRPSRRATGSPTTSSSG